MAECIDQVAEDGTGAGVKQLQQRRHAQNIKACH